MAGTSSARDSNDSLAQAMTRMMDQMLQERDNVAGLDAAIDRIVDTNGCFDGRNVTRYLETYKTEMRKKGIPTTKQVTSFSRIVTSSLYSRVLELQETNPEWSSFERSLLEEYGFGDSSRMTKKDLMDWVESSNKELSASATLHEFEQRFDRLPALDKTILDSNKVLLFIKSVDEKDRRDLGLLLENDEGLISDWAAVKRACGRFDKRRQWDNETRSNVAAQIGWQAHNARQEPQAQRPRDDEMAQPTDGARIDELVDMLREMRISQIRKEETQSFPGRRLDFPRRCIWCDSLEHQRRDCSEFQNALRRDIIYLSNNRIHSSVTQRPLNTNFGRGGMKKLMEEMEENKVNSVYYSSSAGIRAGHETRAQESQVGEFWPIILNQVGKGKLCMDEALKAERRVQEMTGWEDPVEEKSSFVEAMCQTYDVLVEEKRKRPDDQSGPSKKHDTREAVRRREESSLPQTITERGKERIGPAFKLRSEIEQSTDLKRVMEERILDSRIEFTLREVLGIAKKEFHDVIIDLIKRKRLTTSEEGTRPTNVSTSAITTEELEIEQEFADSHFARPHWARATTETPVRMGDLKDSVVALIDHGSEINLMSLDFYRKGRWPINTRHGWKIRAATRATEELHGACPNIKVTIGDVEHDQHFFVQESASHPVILGEPYITASRMETKVLDNGSAYARVRSQDGTSSVQFLTVRPNHERNRHSLGKEVREDF